KAEKRPRRRARCGEPEAADVRKPDGDPFAIYERIYWPFDLLGAALVFAALYMVAKRIARRGSVEQVVTQSSMPAHKAALMLLRLLRDKQLLKQGRSRE